MRDRRFARTGLGTRGFSLVELMVALVLGLVLVLAAGNLFVSNKQTYRTIENLSRLQESLRFAFELLARDARMAGGNPCGEAERVAYVLNGSVTASWTDSVSAQGGTDTITLRNGLSVPACGTTPDTGCRIDGTEALTLQHALGGTVDATVVAHDAPNARMTLDNVDGISVGSVLMVCRPTRAAVFQVTDMEAASSRIEHVEGTAVTPGNCTRCLNYPVDPGCGLAAGSCTSFDDGRVTALEQLLWYVGRNSRGGSSLFRLSGSGREEMVPDVTDMRLAFLTDTGTDYVGLGAVTDWGAVRAVRVTLTVQTPEAVGVDGSAVSRSFDFVVSFRNRLN